MEKQQKQIEFQQIQQQVLRGNLGHFYNAQTAAPQVQMVP